MCNGIPRQIHDQQQKMGPVTARDVLVKCRVSGCNVCIKISAMRLHVATHILRRHCGTASSLLPSPDEACGFCGLIHSVSCTTSLVKGSTKATMNVKSSCPLAYKMSYRSAEKGSNANPCTNRPIPCPTCSVSDVPNAYVWSYHWLDHMQIAHSSQQVSAEQINKFAISKDEYVGVLGKELTAKKLKEEFLLLKTDMLMEPRISLFWSKLMREEWE